MAGAHDMASADDLAEGIFRGERAALAAALNLLDDHRPRAKQDATRLLARLQAAAQRLEASRLIGITGPPGAGKSSLSAALIGVWRERRLRVGVLAVDPSSPLSGGALLGDRLRMKTAAMDDAVFVRSLACRGEFGGLSAEVWPMAQVMLAAFDVTLVETVGVGQREIDVAGMCDTTCYVAQPGSGDSVQYLKAGIIEVPQVLVVNKEDMGPVARRTLSELSGALARNPGEGEWQVRVLSASAARGSGIEALADALEAHHQYLLQRGTLHQRRDDYQADWICKRLREEFGSHGLALLGGEAQVRTQLSAGAASLFQQYEAQRRRLLGHEPASGTH
jgi:LAO/AO transport system kinase